MGDIILGNGIVIPDEELRVRFTRSGGPGGQNVNRRATRVEIVFDLTASPSLDPGSKRRARRRLASRLDTRGRIHVTAQAERTQARNREIAEHRLAALLTEALRPPRPRRRPTKPSKAARARRLESKRRRSDVKQRRRTPGADD